jgi:hypothetical protein
MYYPVVLPFFLQYLANAKKKKTDEIEIHSDDPQFCLRLPPLWSSFGLEFLATDPGSGSIPGATRFYEKQWVWNGVHSAT